MLFFPAYTAPRGLKYKLDFLELYIRQISLKKTLLPKYKMHFLTNIISY